MFIRLSEQHFLPHGLYFPAASLSITHINCVNRLVDKAAKATNYLDKMLLSHLFAPKKNLK